MKNIIAVRLVLQDQLNLQPAKLPENWPRHMLLFARSEKYLLRLSNKSAIVRGKERMEKKRREQDENKMKEKRERGKKGGGGGRYDETDENAIFV